MSIKLILNPIDFNPVLLDIMVCVWQRRSAHTVHNEEHDVYVEKCPTLNLRHPPPFSLPCLPRISSSSSSSSFSFSFCYICFSFLFFPLQLVLLLIFFSLLLLWLIFLLPLSFAYFSKCFLFFFLLHGCYFFFPSLSSTFAVLLLFILHSSLHFLFLHLFVYFFHLFLLNLPPPWSLFLLRY